MKWGNHMNKHTFVCLQEGCQLKTMRRQRWALLFAGLTASPWALQQRARSSSGPGHQRHADARLICTPLALIRACMLQRSPKQKEHSLMVTLLAWMAQRLQSSIKWTMKSSVACSRDGRAVCRGLQGACQPSGPQVCRTHHHSQLCAYMQVCRSAPAPTQSEACCSRP